MGILREDKRIAVEADERVGEVLRRLPEAFNTTPDAATQERHVVAICAAARVAAHQDPAEDQTDTSARHGLAAVPAMKRRHALARNRPLIVTAKLGIAAVALCGLMAALAVAGVTLPGPASDVAKSVGLPNQVEENAGVSDIEGADRAEDVRQDGDRGKPDGVPKGKGDEASADNNGQDTGIGDSVSEDAQNLGDAMREADTPEERRQIADEFSDSVRERAQDRSRLPEQAQSAPQNGEQQGSSETGETQSQGGRAIGEEMSGDHRPDTPADNLP